MASDVKPYVQVNPGDLITADLFNTVQEDVRSDIAQQVTTAVGGITSVKHADDTDTLGGLNIDQLTQQILDKVKAMIPGRTGYLRTFNRLKADKPKFIQHNLGAEPVVDAYQLEYFQVVCAQGETSADAVVEYVNFYLYHTSEKHVRGMQPAGTQGTQPQPVNVVIEDPQQPAFRIAFKDILAEAGVDTTKDTVTLDELVTAFWSALFSAQKQNDAFDPDQYCHSPWFEKCCGELRTIKDLRDRGDWDNIWFKMMPRKTVNYPAFTPIDKNPYTPTNAVALTINGQVPPQPQGTDAAFASTGPTQLEVAHVDYATTGVLLVSDPVPQPNAPPNLKDELAVMLIMKA
ncbi:MAG: hypothetical protein JO103_02885 [Candidatus Eremiobacteraeota bacterium]|nr:hypothetical protein [Candidatus Eremiobacteraeota bacterium]MBV9407285.1 hypothetical protein [Candidatus Eremiobacteraeota bacterium]